MSKFIDSFTTLATLLDKYRVVLSKISKSDSMMFIIHPKYIYTAHLGIRDAIVNQLASQLIINDDAWAYRDATIISNFQYVAEYVTNTSPKQRLIDILIEISRILKQNKLYNNTTAECVVTYSSDAGGNITMTGEVDNLVEQIYTKVSGTKGIFIPRVTLTFSQQINQ